MQNLLQRDLGSSMLSIAVILGWLYGHTLLGFFNGNGLADNSHMGSINAGNKIK